MIAVQQLLHLARHGLLFIVAKFVVLAAPLLAAGLLSKTLYGTTEWWLSIAAALGPIFALGAPGVIAYGTIRHDNSNNVRLAGQYSAGISTVLVSVGSIFLLYGAELDNLSPALVAYLCAVIVLQTALAARLKALGKGAWASLVEGSLYICLLNAVLANHIGFDFVNSLISTLVFAWLVLASALFWLNPSSLAPGILKGELVIFLKVGSHFMIAGALMGIFMAMPRMALGSLSEPDHVAAFALDFRWMSISIAAHQFINTVYFRKIFSNANDLKRDILQAITVCIVAVGCLCIIAFLHFTQGLHAGIPTPKGLDKAWLFAVAMILWSATSCLEGNLQRHNSNRTQIRSVLWGLAVVTTGIGILTIAKHHTSIAALTSIWIAGFFAMIFTQLRMMKPLNCSTIRLRQATFGSIFLLSIIGFIYTRSQA